MARTKILTLSNSVDYPFNLYDIETKNNGQEFYLDMSNPLMAYVDGGVLFVDISLTFERYLDVIAIKLPDGVNYVGEQGYHSSPFLPLNTFIYDLELFLSLSYGFTPPSVDFTPLLGVLTSINDRVYMLPDFESSSAIVSGALLSLDAVELNNLHEDIVSLGTQLSTVTVPLQSLNGNGCEFIDGTTVTVYGRDDVVYSVSRSYMAMIDDNSYTAVYDLESVNGAKCTAPESLLTLYVAPVVTTP